MYRFVKVAGHVVPKGSESAYAYPFHERLNFKGPIQLSSGFLNPAHACQEVDLDKAIKIKPALAKAYSNRGNARIERGDLPGAFSDLDKAIAMDLRMAPAYYGRANAWRAKGDEDRAVADYSQAIELEPRYVMAYINRGTVYLLQRKWKEAIRDYNEAIQVDPGNA